jgi:hypothetical protein
MKSIIIKEDGRDTQGHRRYDVKMYEDKLMVHHMVFIDPEFAEHYAEQYMLNVWNGKEFSLFDTIH